jgi:predicted GNAT family acetyltransferase
MGEWAFLTKHARALLCIAHDPRTRLRDLATDLDVTERTAYGIVVDLTAAGYLVKQKDGRRNRYRIQGHLPLREAVGRERTIGEVLDLLVDADRRPRSASAPLSDRHALGVGTAPNLAPREEATMAIEVRRNRDLSRYEIFVDGDLGGIADYDDTGGPLVFPHTQVVPGLRGRGLADRLVREALDDVRRDGRTLVPRCSYVARFIRRHPEYSDLLAA